MDTNISIEQRSLLHCLADSEFLNIWKKLLNERPHSNALLSSPAWLSSLSIENQNSISILIIRDGRKNVIGLIPLEDVACDMSFSVGKKCLYKKRFRGMKFLGGRPILDIDARVLESLLGYIFSMSPAPDAVTLESISDTSDLQVSLNELQHRRTSVKIHKADGPRAALQVKIQPTFKEYLKSMSSKSRANIRRELRRIQADTNAELRLSRITQSSEIEEFLSHASNISQHSWQHQAIGERVKIDEASLAFYKKISDEGHMRSYLLSTGSSPCAFVIGYQHQGIYSYAEIGYHQEFSKYSPGKLLLYLLLEDLHQVTPPDLLSFGAGDATYKRRFGNTAHFDADYYCFRRTWKNIFWIYAHASFNEVIKRAKNIIGREVTK